MIGLTILLLFIIGFPLTFFLLIESFRKSGNSKGKTKVPEVKQQKEIKPKETKISQKDVIKNTKENPPKKITKKEDKKVESKTIPLAPPPHSEQDFIPPPPPLPITNMKHWKRETQKKPVVKKSYKPSWDDVVKQIKTGAKKEGGILKMLKKVPKEEISGGTLKYLDIK